METEVGRVVLKPDDRKQRDLPEPTYLSTSHGNGGARGCTRRERHRTFKTLVVTDGFGLPSHLTLHETC